MKQRITDISITQTDAGFRLLVPIATGHLETFVTAGNNPELDRFLASAFATPSRRFGEELSAP